MWLLLWIKMLTSLEHSDVIHHHSLGENSRGIRTSGPFATDSDIKNKKEFLCEGTRSAGVISIV